MALTVQLIRIKTNQVLGLMNIAYSLWSDEIGRIIYPTFVKQLYEFDLLVWNSHLEYDPKLFENISKCLAQSKFMKESHHLSYDKRLEILGLTDLKTRREMGDFIQIYKIVHSLEKVNWCDVNKILRPEQNIDIHFSSLVSEY